jgi:hypothetical protein
MSAERPGLAKALEMRREGDPFIAEWRAAQDKT